MFERGDEVVYTPARFNPSTMLRWCQGGTARGTVERVLPNGKIVIAVPFRWEPWAGYVERGTHRAAVDPKNLTKH